jgi:hypothetical protein
MQIDFFKLERYFGSMFDYPGNHFRIGLGRKSFPEALRALEGMLVEMPAGSGGNLDKPRSG